MAKLWQKISSLLTWWTAFSAWQVVVIHELGHLIAYKYYGVKLKRFVIGKHKYLKADGSFAFKPQYQQQYDNGRVYFIASVSHFINSNDAINGLVTKSSSVQITTAAKFIISCAGLLANLTIIIAYTCLLNLLFITPTLYVVWVLVILLAYPTYLHAKYLKTMCQETAPHSDIQKIKQHWRNWRQKNAPT